MAGITMDSVQTADEVQLADVARLEITPMISLAVPVARRTRRC